ncbi:unnamed protein product [Brachionus calyciflorus]|uniref:Saposin B-type domain-containing protein n=1 Tax=Brachionus calyciflorus TaxID=104777 RepID=A0A814H3G5_9BILA|nr:unnamed protein product [Brachionus calyciflorus]
MIGFAKITFGCLLIVQLISAEKHHVPNPFSRVSGKSFLPDKSMNRELLDIKSDVYPLTFGGPKNMIPKMRYGLSFCKTCINFADQALDTLLNAILNVGVIGECSQLCNYVAQKVGSEIVDVVCNLLCDFVGIKEFITIIEKADLDPIWYCELLKACPINDYGDARITEFEVVPSKGPQGTFTINLTYESNNGTGTGELYIGVKTVDRIPVEDSFLLEASKPGIYQTQIRLNAVPDQECDPSQGPCEQWQPGVYFVETAICNGECGSLHPHSEIYDQAQANFTIV